MENVDHLTFGELIKVFRLRTGLTQVQFAKQLEKSRRSLIDWEAGNSRPQTKGDLLDIARVAQLSEEETTLLLKAGGQDPTPLVWSIPYLPNHYFTGREAILERLANELFVSQPLTVSQPVALSGLGGIGKTQIALEYAYRFYRKYQAVLWVVASDRDKWIASYVTLAEQLNLPEKDAQEQTRVVQAVKQWLQSHSRWLLLLDDVADFSLMRDFLPSLHKGHILLTTRAQAMGGLAHVIEIERMEEENSILFLLHRASLLPLHTPFENATSADIVVARAICNELGRLPLALDQAGAYIEETQCGLSQYLHLYQTHRAALLQRRGSFLPDHPESVATTWSLSFEKIERRSPVAADVLRLCAFFHSDAIPEELIVLSASLEETQLAPLKENPLLLDETIAILGAYSLIQREPRTKTISIHRLVQTVLKDAMEKVTFDWWANTTVLLVNRAFPNGWFDTWSACERIFPHAIAALALIEQAHIVSQEAARLLNQTGGYLKERGRYIEAESMAQRTRDMCEQVLGPDHPLTACSLSNLATLSFALGRYEQADALAQRSLTCLERVLDGKYEVPSDAAFFLATGLNNLASLYHEQGKYDQAELLLVRSLAIWSHTFGPIHPMMAYVQNNLGSLYEDQGQYDDAEALYQQALTVAEHLFGSNHPLVATCLNNLSCLYTNHSDKQEQSEALAKRALSLCEAELGPHHPQTATSLANLASISYMRGDNEQAESLWKRALSINEHVFGLNHTTVARILNNLANLYSAQDQYVQAESFLKRAISIWEMTLGEKHHEMLDLLLNYIVLLHDMNREEEAEQVKRRAKHLAEQLQQVPPPQHDQQETQTYQEMLQRTHHDALDNLDRLHQLTEEALKKHLTQQEREKVDRFRELLWILLEDMQIDPEEQTLPLSLAENIRVGWEIEELLQQSPFIDLDERSDLRHIPGIGYVSDDFPFESAEDMAANAWWTNYSLHGFIAYTRFLVLLRHFTYLPLSTKDQASLRKLRKVIAAWKQDWLEGPLPDIHYTSPSEMALKASNILDQHLFRKKHEEIFQLPDYEVLKRLHSDDIQLANGFRNSMAQRFETVKGQVIEDLKKLGKIP
ncbi:tetratricopeptide repeat protein [Ktedonobacteria bacterium brp13]|nr:tetratricopeptide repeat protein [Ktedonobacteria bacterium brp13]